MQLSHAKKIVLLVLVLVLSMATVGTFYLVKERDRDERDVASRLFTSNSEAPTYTDILGNPIQLETYLGNLVVVTTWASWSPFSASDLGKLQQLAKDFEEDSVAFLALNRKETREQAQRYIETVPELQNITLVIDTEDRFYLETGGYAMPETIVFDENGEIILHLRGEIQVDVITALLRERL